MFIVYYVETVIRAISIMAKVGKNKKLKFAQNSRNLQVNLQKSQLQAALKNSNSGGPEKANKRNIQNII